MTLGGAPLGQCRGRFKMSYPRLTKHAHPVPTDTFAFCQVCGTRFSDLPVVRLYEEWDDQDQREPGNYILIGQCCKAKMESHPRGYSQVPWGRGEPGALVLLCGDCPHRSGFQCSHPHAKSNGGKGILVAKDFPLGSASIHINCGKDSGYIDFFVYNQCEGHPSKNKVPTESP